jgi:hypothetical protein
MNIIHGWSWTTVAEVAAGVILAGFLVGFLSRA